VTVGASAIDAAAFGEYRSTPSTAPRFRTRITAAGAPGTLPAAPRRYHIYGSRSSPASHRLEIIRAVAGLADCVSLSHVDGLRDARGWAFREATGVDTLNGFALLSEAYKATEPNWTGEPRVPVLWDRTTRRIVSDDAIAMGIDLATQFGTIPGLYQVSLAAEIERVSAALKASFSDRLVAATRSPDAADHLRSTLRNVDAHLANHRYLLGDVLTDADLRFWVQLVRYDLGVNAHRTLGPALSEYPNLWSYARALFRLASFRDTTDLTAFAAPFADVAAWLS